MRIVQFIPSSGSWGDINPTTMAQTGLGGRETALVQLGEAWANQGHEVVNFVPTKKPYNYTHLGGGRSHYLPQKGCGDHIFNFGADVAVSWEEPRLFANDQLRDRIKLGIVEMQVSNLITNKATDSKTDKYAVLSEWAGDYLLEQNENIDPRKLIVFPNGVDMSRYSEPHYGRPTDGPYRFYYSSSPDRGLNHLLRLWPKLRERFPDAELFVAYGIEHWVEAVQWSHNMQAQAALDVVSGLRQPGVNYVGRMGQKELARLQESCDALLYTCDTVQPTETGCITVVEAGAACTPAIITSCDCLGSEFNRYTAQVDLPFNEDHYVDLVDEVMKDSSAYEFYQRAGRSLAESRNWAIIANQWLSYFGTELGLQSHELGFV